jgi:hypothetical protein
VIGSAANIADHLFWVFVNFLVPHHIHFLGEILITALKRADKGSIIRMTSDMVYEIVPLFKFVFAIFMFTTYNMLSS